MKWLNLADYLNVAQLGGVRLDLRVLAFAAAVSLSTGLLFGLVPALKASQSNFNDALKAGGRDAMGSRHRTRIRSLLVMTEIAFSLVLLTGAGLMIGSLRNLLGVSLGFNPENVITMRLSLPEARYSIPRTAAFYHQLQDRVRGLPGVEAVAIVNQLPMTDVTANASFDVEGRPSNTDINVADTQIISPDYFRAMGISLMRGRFLNDEEARLPPASVIVNQTLARKVWPGTDPIGKRIRLGPDYPWLSVVGVVADIKNHGSNVATKPEMYFLLTDQPFQIWVDLRSMTLVVRTSFRTRANGGRNSRAAQTTRPGAANLQSLNIEGARLIVHLANQVSCAHAVAVRVRRAAARRNRSLRSSRLHSCAKQARDWRAHGARRAAGSNPEILSRPGSAVGSIGWMCGAPGGFILVRFMRSMLFQVGPYDPKILSTGAAVLSAVVLMACLIPALRAAKVDPIAALKSD